MGKQFPEFTPTEKDILGVLSDGQRHSPQTLRQYLPIADELSPATALQQHISNIRKKLDRFGKGIVCEFHNKRKSYRLVRFIKRGE